MLPELTQEEVFRYARHLTIPDVGIEGQRKLKAATVLVVGVGGLGSVISLYLAAAGVGHIGLVDFDTVDSSNLQRQVIHDSLHLGKLKVESARERMHAINPLIEIDVYPETFETENAEKIAHDYSIIMDGTDNFGTRYLINDLCVLTRKTYVYGSIFQFEGQVSVFDARQGPCYRCLFAEPPPAISVPTGVQSGVFGVLPGTIGTLQASEALKLVMGVGSSLVSKLILYDALDMSFHKIELRKNPDCEVCGTSPKIKALLDYRKMDAKPDVEKIGEDWEITPINLLERLKQEDDLLLLDVREPGELQISRLAGITAIPIAQLSARLDELDRNREIITICRNGVRSAWALQMLRKAGFPKVRNLFGGMNAWANDVDPNMYNY